MWRPRSLFEVLEEGGTTTLPKDRNGRYRCPNCGVSRPAAVIVDVSSLPISENWACDACWTKWQRQGRDVDGNGQVGDRFDWARRWAVAHGAPENVRAKLSKR